MLRQWLDYFINIETYSLVMTFLDGFRYMFNFRPKEDLFLAEKGTYPSIIAIKLKLKFNE